MTALRETAIAAIATRLTTQIPTATVERARRAPVDLDGTGFPYLIVAGTDWTPDESAEPLVIHYTLGITITGIVRARTDILAEQAMHELHSQVTAALVGWTPATDGLGEPAQADAEFRLIDAEESAKPAGEFTARFTMLCLGPLIAA